MHIESNSSQKAKTSRPIYLDYNATTPLDPQIFELMLPYLKEDFGNPASASHSYGWSAQMAVDNARLQLARGLGVRPKEIIFTSGATESNNLALIGFVRPFLQRGDKVHIISTAIEHKAILETLCALEKQGADVSYCPVNSYGQMDLNELQTLIRPETRLVTCMWANNEIGSINPIDEIATLCKSKDIVFHSDAAQAVGKVPVDLSATAVDMLSISGHKMYGPKGIGALIVRNRQPEIELAPLFFGGSQEKGLRPGTLNVPAVVGLGAAMELFVSLSNNEGTRLNELSSKFLRRIQNVFPQVILNGHPSQRVPGQLNLSFPGVVADLLFSNLSGLALSSGSACSSGEPKPSYVLTALGREPQLAKASLRIAMGRFTGFAEIDQAADIVISALTKSQQI